MDFDGAETATGAGAGVGGMAAMGVPAGKIDPRCVHNFSVEAGRAPSACVERLRIVAIARQGRRGEVSGNGRRLGRGAMHAEAGKRALGIGFAHADAIARIRGEVAHFRKAKATPSNPIPSKSSMPVDEIVPNGDVTGAEA